jgi:Glycosyltransferase family 87
MTAAQRANLRIAAIFCGVLGLCGVIYVVLILSRRIEIAPLSDVLFPDFLVFYAAARAFFAGKLALVYDHDAFTQYQNVLFLTDRLPRPAIFRPFFYPPTWLLMLLPFGLLGIASAYCAFMSLTAAAATAVVGRRDWWGWLAIATSPAAVWVVLAGQNTFFSIALFYGGFRLLDRAPAVAGILFGMLSYKPQIWVLVPLTLLAARQWRGLGWTIGTAFLLSLASIATFGFDVWLAFLDSLRQAGSPHLADDMFGQIYMHMTTLLAAARIVGLPLQVAGALQVGGAILAIVAVWCAFRRRGSNDARIAVLVAATFLISPYSLNYDLLLLMPAAVALFRQGLVQGFHSGERLIYAALWVIPTLCIVLNRMDLPVTPLVIVAFGGVAWMRLKDRPKVELPSVATAG